MPALQHVVLIRLNDKCGSHDVATFNEQFTKIVQEIDGMVCGSVTAVEYAKKFSTKNKGGFTHCVYCLFDHIDGLDQYYNNSPEHEKLKGMIGKFMDGALEDNILEFDSWNPSIPSSLSTVLAAAESAEEKKSDDKSSNPLEDEMAALKLKFGALKWAEVQEKGYPQPRRDDKVVDIYKNAKDESIEVQDPYRWLEDPDCAESRQWIDEQVFCVCDPTNFINSPFHPSEQVDICGAYLSKCGAVKEIYDTIMENQNFPRFGTPSRKGSDPVIYYYAHNSGLQNQSVLYFHEGSLDAPRQCLLDPNTLSDDGTTSAKGYYFSDNAKYLCYGLSKAGSDWREFHVKVECRWFVSCHS